MSFSLDGSSYELDACASHGAQIREAFAPYVAVGRRAGRGVAGRRGRVRRTTSGSDPAAVREWARANRVKVSERGRISADVLEQYAAASK